MPEGPDNTGTQEPIVLPEMQDDPLQLTPPAYLPQTPEESIQPTHLQTSLEQNKVNDPWGDMETYQQTPTASEYCPKM